VGEVAPGWLGVRKKEWASVAGSLAGQGKVGLRGGGESVGGQLALARGKRGERERPVVPTWSVAAWRCASGKEKKSGEVEREVGGQDWSSSAPPEEEEGGNGVVVKQVLGLADSSKKREICIDQYPA